MRDTSEVIAACPFCGADDAHVIGITATGESSVICYTCGGETAHKATAAEAIAAWNRRPAAEPADAGRDAVAWMLTANEHWPMTVTATKEGAERVLAGCTLREGIEIVPLYPRPSREDEGLRKLIADWRERASARYRAHATRTNGADHSNADKSLVLDCCADELEAALASQQAVKP